MDLDILVVGNGAREHALVWKLVQSVNTRQVYCAPGNPGTADLARNVPIDVLNLDQLVSFSVEHAIHLVVVGPEAPLAAGLADRLRSAGIATFGPSRAAAQIESSKSWAKDIMNTFGVPTANHVSTTDKTEALRRLSEFGLPVVVKTDGLAAGKGVVIAESVEEAQAAVERFLGSEVTGAPVIIEEYLEGKEISVFGVTDGEMIVPFLPACDYKRAYTGDQGPNTGGMGAYTPVPDVGFADVIEISRTILEPVVAGMRELGHPMNGVLYAGLMLTSEGPKVLEFNARFGDPEIQVLLPLLESDFAELLFAAATSQLGDSEHPIWSPKSAVGVVLASCGYPGEYTTGQPISGLEDTGPSSHVFQAGTVARDHDLVTSGGRVLTVTSIGRDIAEAREQAYSAVSAIEFDGMEYRTDIAEREI